MGKNLIILWVYLISSVFLSSCSDELRERQIISHAEKLVALYPDSALTVLDSIAFPEEMSRPLAARWSQLYARSADKVGKHLPYVDQMKPAVDYYRSEKRYPELAEAGLYLGRSYVDDKEYDKAMTAYVDALSVALRIEDYNRAGYICSYMADLYEIDGSYQKSAEKYEEGNRYFKEAGNMKSYAFGLVNAAFGYVVREEKQEALDLLLLADSVAEVLGDPEVMSYVYSGLGNVYEEYGMYDQAEEYQRKALSLDDGSGELAAYIALAGILCETHRTQDAFSCLKKAEILLGGPDDKIRKAAINHQYYKIAKSEEDYKNALSHLEEYMLVADSVDKEQESVNILDMESKYNYVKAQNENNQLKIDRQYHYIGLFILLSILLLLLVIYLLNIKRKNHIIYEQQQQINQQNEKIYSVMVELQQKKAELHEQSLRIEETKKLLRVQGTLDEEMKKYDLLKENIHSLSDELINLRTDKLLQSTAAKKLQKMSKFPVPNAARSLITDRYWKTIEEQVLSVYPAVLNPMRNVGLTLAERRFCYLTLFKLDTTEIAILLKINPDSVIKQRLRVRQKFGLVGKEIDLYRYLISFW